MRVRQCLLLAALLAVGSSAAAPAAGGELVRLSTAVELKLSKICQECARAQPSRVVVPSTPAQGLSDEWPETGIVVDDDGLLSINVEDTSLRSVLHGIAAKTGCEILLYGDLDEPVTRRFTRLPPNEGLKRVLRHGGHASVMVHESGSNNSGKCRLGKIIVMSSNARNAQAIATPQPAKADAIPDHERRRRSKLKTISEAVRRKNTEATNTLIDLLLHDEDAHVRKSSAGALAAFRGSSVTRAFIDAVEDEASAVRHMAISNLARIGGPVARGALIEIVQGHQDPVARRKAATRLARFDSRATRTALTSVAANDENAKVSAAARKSLSKLGRRD